MGYHHHGHAIKGQLPHHIQHLSHLLGIEGTGGLIEKHDSWFHAKGPSNGHPLLLAATQLTGELIGLGTDAHPLQQGQSLLPHLRPRPFTHPNWRQQEVVEHR